MKIFVACNKYILLDLSLTYYIKWRFFFFLTQISVSNVKYTQILRVFHPNEKRKNYVKITKLG